MATDEIQRTKDGTHGQLAVHEWPNEDARYLLLLVHGYGEHLGRYQHVADHLVAHGAHVVGPDHLGHGRSEGERVLIDDMEDLVVDLHAVWEDAAAPRPGLPTVLLGHSMGGHVAARYAQEHGDELAAVVLSAPLIGRLDIVDHLLALPEIPDVPLDPTTLSRDPEVGEAYAADPLVWHGPFKRRTLEAFRAGNEAVLAGGTLAPRPLLWIHGADDQLVPLEGARVAIDTIAGPDRTDRHYAGGKHESFNEINRDTVLTDLTDWIDAQLTGQRDH